MADELPTPASRKEQYLATIAGMTGIDLPKPASRIEEYLAAIAENGGGGGGSYTAGDGIKIADDTISVDTTTIQEKLTAGDNITIADDTISATDTTYSNFVGTDGTAAGTAGLVPAPATTDAGKFLKADGTWDTAGGGGPTVVQTIGDSTTDVMSQNAVTNTIFADHSSQKVKIGDSAISSNTWTIGIGYNAWARGPYSVAIGANARTGTYNQDGIVIGRSAIVAANNAIALGHGASAQNPGEMNIGTPNALGSGYNNSNYRLLTGLYDGSSAHDAATYGQMNTRLGGLTLLTISQTDYDNLGTKDPNTLYVITGA